jgi:hypothetical protein
MGARFIAVAIFLLLEVTFPQRRKKEKRTKVVITLILTVP